MAAGDAVVRSTHSEAWRGNSRCSQLLEPGLARELLEAAPELGPPRLGEPGAHRCEVERLLGHRWQVEQLVSVASSSTLYSASRVLPKRLLAAALGRRLPVEVVDLRLRPDVLLGIAVAVDAPLHLERGVLEGELHLVDPAVARDAADALGDVDRVVEVDVVRQVVHARPADRPSLSEAVAHRPKDLGRRPNPSICSRRRCRRA